MIVIMPGYFSESEVDLQVVQAANSIFQQNAKCQVPSQSSTLALPRSFTVDIQRFARVTPSPSSPQHQILIVNTSNTRLVI